MGFIGTSDAPSVVVDAGVSGSQWRMRIASTTSAVLLLSGTTDRSFGSVFNHGAASVYLGFGFVPTTSFFDVKLTSGSYFEIQKPTYRGPIYGVWDAVNGFAMVHETSGTTP